MDSGIISKEEWLAFVDRFYMGGARQSDVKGDSNDCDLNDWTTVTTIG